MKRIYVGVTALLFSATLMVMVLPAQAQQSELSDGSAGYTCYATYDSGTTTFTDCNGCNHAQGTNLKDSSTCGG